MKIYIVILAVMLSACSTIQIPQENNGPAKKSVDAPENESVYFFQHRLLPQWTFNSQGAFLDDLLNNDLTALKQAAGDVVSPEYANQIVVNALPDKNAVLLIFPEPKGLAHCYFILIAKAESTFAFYTYEKTMTFGDKDNVKGVVGTWTSEGSHGNLGPRTYTTADKFIEDILGD